MSKQTRSMGSWPAILALGALLLGSSLVAQQSRFEETTTVTVVEVPVQVMVDGAPMKSLTKDDFEVFDNRKRQEIVGFDLVDLSTTSTVRDGIPVAARRHFLILFDLSFSDLDSVGRARAAASQLVSERLHPTDLVAVATYSQARGPQMVLGFTPDRIQIRHAIATLGLTTPGERVVDPLGLVIADIDAELPESDLSTGVAAIADVMAESAHDLKVLQGRVARDQKKNQVLAMTSSMELLAKMMNSIEGRKHVLLLSEGFDSSVLVGIQGTSQEDQQRIEEINQAVADGQYWLVDDEERFGSGQTQSALSSMLEEFRRANCAIQAINIGGLVAGQHNENLEGLYAMAADTGGELYSNYNDLGEAMSEMLERTSVTYLLAFQPEDLANDGRYHQLKVKLKDGPRGVQLVHRPGYYAPKPYEQQSPLERRLASAERVVDGREGGVVGTSLLVAGFEMPGERAYVPVLIEVDGESLLRDVSTEVTTVEIYAYALDPQGTVRDFFARRTGFDLRQAGPTVREKGFKYWGHFDLDPGEYWVRVLVRNDDTGLSGVSSGEVTIASTELAEALLLPPFFPEPFDRWVWGREEESERRPGAPHPFQYGEDPFFPAAKPEVEVGREVPVSLMAYHLGAGRLAVDCQIFDSTGKEIPEAGSLSVSADAKESAGLLRLPATFTVKDLEPGDYLMVVTLKNLENDEEQTSSISIRVV